MKRSDRLACLFWVLASLADRNLGLLDGHPAASGVILIAGVAACTYLTHDLWCARRDRRMA